MSDTNITLQNKKVILFFDYHHDQMDIEKSVNLRDYCDQNNYDIVETIHKNEEEYGMHHELLLHVIKNYEGDDKLTIIIDKDTYNLSKNLISCALIGALQRLELIDIHVCDYSKLSEESDYVTVSPYDEKNDSSFIKKATRFLNRLI